MRRRLGEKLDDFVRRKQISYKEAVPMYRFNTASYDNANNGSDGNQFTARPIKHWRKQLQATTLHEGRSISHASIGMPMDRPGGQVITSVDTLCNTCNGSAELIQTIHKDSSCKSCNPIKSNIQDSDNRYISNKAYMQSRCITSDQKLAYNPASFVTYFSTAGIPLEPSDSSSGAQVRETNACYTPLYPSTYTQQCNTTIYKPNNSQFAQQGGVSSGSRISRLKYNTLNNNGAAYNSASGAVGINTGRYQTEPSPSYYTKLKPPPILYPYKTGDKSYCKAEYSVCA